MNLRRNQGIAWLALLMIAAVLAAGAEDRAQVKAKLAHETDPIRRARAQIRLAELKLEEAAKRYEEGAPETGLAHLQEMLSLVVEAHDQLFGTGRDPRKRPKGFKEAEIKLREISRRLEDLRVALPVDERGEIEKIAARVVEIRDHLLHGIMRVKDGKK